MNYFPSAEDNLLTRAPNFASASSMIADALRQIDQGEQPEIGATHFAPKAGGIESRAGRVERLGLLVQPLALRASRRLRRVPWRHTWIIALAVLLLILAFCGIFHERRTIRHVSGTTAGLRQGYPAGRGTAMDHYAMPDAHLDKRVVPRSFDPPVVYLPTASMASGWSQIIWVLGNFW